MAATAKTDHALERLVFFSDAVFAIAITLLIIEVHPPHLAHGAGDAVHWRALAGLLPNFFGFVLSFWVIGMFWMGHHRAFALAGRYNPQVLGWNLALLCMIAFIPFVTGYLSANSGARVPVLLYCGTMIVAGLLNLRLNGIATGPSMVAAHVSAEQIAYIRTRGLSVPLGAATALALAFVSPILGLVGLMSIGLWRRLLTAVRHTPPAS